MSARRLRRVLAPRAGADLRDVLLYTKQRWGTAQRDTYRHRLYEGFDELTRHPNLGRERPEYGPDSRSFRIQHHIVVYRVIDDELRILRILHVRRDIEHEFDE